MAEVERVPVTVLLVVGDRAELVTPQRGADDPEVVPVARLVEATGLPALDLPGRRVTALVRDGELIGFDV